MNNELIGETLQLAREHQGIKKTEMAKLLKCSDSTINNYEKGEGIKSFANLIALATAYNLDLKDIFGIDYMQNINNGEQLLDSATRNLMGKNIAKYNSNERFINSKENNALIFYNNLLGNITDGIMKDIFEYMLYPSKNNIYLDDSNFVNDYQCDPYCPDKFYDDEREQVLETKATIVFQKLMKRIRESEEIVKWIKYFEQKQREYEEASVESSIWWHEQEMNMTEEEQKEMQQSAIEYHEENMKIIEQNKTKISNYRNQIRSTRERKNKAKKDS